MWLRLSKAERAFPTRFLRAGALEALGEPEALPDPARINQHIEGRSDGRRVMTDEEVTSLLNDPFATLVLRHSRFPRTLHELLSALDEHNESPDGLPEQETYLVSEGGQIPFQPGLDKGGSRLITVRFRENSPELMVSTLLPPGASLGDDGVLLEVQAWDPIQKTMHFYQRQEGAWFWAGQSDMAFEPDTRGEGPFDSHVNGYPIMKELKSPWVHWHGPGLGIAETAFAPDDPLVSDPLFLQRDHALNFEQRVIRPLCERWNKARFEKNIRDGELQGLPFFVSQVIEATSANLISTHTEFSQLDRRDLDDLPATFFFDEDSLVSEIGLAVEVPLLRMSRKRYMGLIETYDLRVRGGEVNQAGDVPFCFMVPERALEDVLVVKILIRRGVMTPRLAACLLMVDYPNPIGSERRASLMNHVPAAVGFDETTNLDAVLVPSILKVAANGAGSAESEFANHWNLGPEDWKESFADRIEKYLKSVVESLDTEIGCDAIFRLAESRRREFRRRPLAEFRLGFPHAFGIPNDSPALEMTEKAEVRERPAPGKS